MTHLKRLWLGLGLGLIILTLSLALSLTLGAANITLKTIYHALFSFDPTSVDHVIIRTARLPRLFAGVMVGMGLAVSGSIMQGLTRNPLASPEILGVNAGASFAVVLGVYLLGSPPLSIYAWLAMIGATCGGSCVYLLGSWGRGGATPLRLTLAGAIFTTFTTSLTTGLLILEQNTFDQIRFWTVGSLNGRDMALWWQTAPYIIMGLCGAMLLGHSLTVLSLGEEVAHGLGQNVPLIKMLAAISVVFMAGGSVALAGPVGFIGLLVPHSVRFTVGADYRWLIPYSALLGAILVVVADMFGRILLRPEEIPLGVMLTFVGAPFFIYLVRQRAKDRQ